MTLAASALVVATLLARQLLAVLDNRRLVVELVNTQHELHHQAFHDPLTGIANRALFADRLHHGLELHRRDLRPLSLLYCDLDGFKTINDTLGHDVGDQVIKISAERLRARPAPPTLSRDWAETSSVSCSNTATLDALRSRTRADGSSAMSRQSIHSTGPLRRLPGPGAAVTGPRDCCAGFVAGRLGERRRGRQRCAPQGSVAVGWRGRVARIRRGA